MKKVNTITHSWKLATWWETITTEIWANVPITYHTAQEIARRNIKKEKQLQKEKQKISQSISGDEKRRSRRSCLTMVSREVRMYKDLDMLPGGKYTGEINFLASHLTSVLWQDTISCSSRDTKIIFCSTKLSWVLDGGLWTRKYSCFSQYKIQM